MRIVFTLCFLTVLTIGTPQSAFAQRGTIQQPVVSQFGVGTTVSVPDRGRAHLGSVSRAGDSRTSFGPFSPGSSRGFFREHSGVSVGVTIQDLGEMDRRLLQQGRRMPTGPRLSRRAENAYESLLSRYGGGKQVSESDRPESSSVVAGRSIGTRETTRRATEPARSTSRRVSGSNGQAAVKYLAEGLLAENRGKMSLARNYYRIAAQLGSETANRRHARLVAEQSPSAIRR